MLLELAGSLSTEREKLQICDVGCGDGADRPSPVLPDFIGSASAFTPVVKPISWLRRGVPQCRSGGAGLCCGGELENGCSQ